MSEVEEVRIPKKLLRDIIYKHRPELKGSGNWIVGLKEAPGRRSFVITLTRRDANLRLGDL